MILTVYDLAGRRVRRLLDGRLEAGDHVAKWNGRDERERAQSSGIYFCRLTAGGESASRKMILMK